MADIALAVTDLQISASRRRKEAVVRVALFAAATLSVVITVLIVVSLVGEALAFVRGEDFTWNSLTDIGWFPRRGFYDIGTLIVGSLIVTVIAMLVAWPLGVGAAIYLSEYAQPRVRRVLKPVLEILAGIPSVVLGFFALTVISPDLVQTIFTDSPQFNLLAAGLGVGILTIPLVASISEDALRSVPNALREASEGLGARKMTTTVQVVIPAAVSGLMAALIVGVSRAIGETMVVAIAAGGQWWLAVHHRSARSRPDHDRGHGLAGDRDRSGAGGQRRLPEPVLRRPGAVRHHPAAQHPVRALRSPRPSAVLGVDRCPSSPNPPTWPPSPGRRSPNASRAASSTSATPSTSGRCWPACSSRWRFWCCSSGRCWAMASRSSPTGGWTS